MKYRVTFDRIGRNRSVKPLDVTATDVIDLACKISDYARPHIRSRDYDVGVNDDMSGGDIIVGGFRPAGEFTVVPIQSEP